MSRATATRKDIRESIKSVIFAIAASKRKPSRCRVFYDAARVDNHTSQDAPCLVQTSRATSKSRVSKDFIMKTPKASVLSPYCTRKARLNHRSRPLRNGKRAYNGALPHTERITHAHSRPPH